MKPLILIICYISVVTLPLILSWLVGGPPREIHQELASGLGILAFAMILMEFVLSGRFKTISNDIGMDVTMRFHQMMARIALGFAVLHPFLYRSTPSGGQRPWDTTRQLTITTDISELSTGIAAYLLLPSLVLLAIGRTKLDFKYETWRLIHGVGALLIAALLLHHTVYAGRYGSQPVMTAVWLAMTGLSVGSLCYVYLLVPLRDKARAWHVTSVVRVASKQWEVTVAPDGHSGLKYDAGQFVWLNVGNSTFSLRENPFSISSAPAAGPEISFMIKEFGDFTQNIGQILRQMRLTGDPRKVKLIYGNRSVDQIAYREELGLEDVTYVLSEQPEAWQGETGFIDGPLLDRTFSREELTEWVFVVCGPPLMMDIVEDHLIMRDTPSHRILSERFSYD
jgi:predicted ferric reductase